MKTVLGLHLRTHWINGVMREFLPVVAAAFRAEPGSVMDVGWIAGALPEIDLRRALLHAFCHTDWHSRTSSTGGIPLKSVAAL
jgi:hypothetical protein